MLHINVASVIFADPTQENGLPELNFTLANSSFSLHELIARSVENQVHDLLDDHQRTHHEARAILDRHFLAADEVRTQATTGKVAMPAVPKEMKIEPETEVQRALRAFRNGQFKVFINGREYTDLDEQLTYDDAIKVKFLRIMPLVGG